MGDGRSRDDDRGRRFKGEFPPPEPRYLLPADLVMASALVLRVTVVGGHHADAARVVRAFAD
jgi:hypothetical protein